MASILGWKDILRPIRDGYRHLFPTPDTGPSPEERRLQRERDRLKGFEYFDTFDQLEGWEESDSDPLQISNTPLLPRIVGTAAKEGPKARVLLVHDYAGNYHDYENVQGADLAEEMYACEDLQYVDSFVYFSHKLVCVPPPTWANTLHRNGVLALGTILVEPQTKETDRFLQHTSSDGNMTFGLATKLANIAKHYGFDGYLVNIEIPFPREAWSPNILQAFLVQLRDELGDNRQLVWYDALTTSNKISYQNALTASNLLFAQACGGILTNYCWGESEASRSKTIALQSGFPPEQIFFGVDVWAQNNSGSHQSRSTYPKKGGGGTNTGAAVTKLAELGLSAGIFAPAWSFEHFPVQGRAIERTMWHGDDLPNDVDCSCGNAAVRHQQTQGCCITKSARCFPAGWEMFFFTDFSRSFAKHVTDGPLHAQLGAQAPLPIPVPCVNQGSQARIAHRLAQGPQSKLVIEAHNCIQADVLTQYFDCYIPLYSLNMPAVGGLALEVTYRNLATDTGAVPSLSLKLINRDEPRLLPIEDNGGVHTMRAKIGPQTDTDEGGGLKELGFHLTGFGGEGTVPILEIYPISITPLQSDNVPHVHSIYEVQLQHRGEGENKHVRLCWKFTGTTEDRLSGIPYSHLTGPFSYFLVNINGTQCGRTYTLESILTKEMQKTFTEKELEVEIIGVGFVGQNLARHVTALHLSSELI
ncbi:hypothetical protein HBI37_002250 [Parastagonospora nodorum]|nr:hypothetical protein HBH52_205120 [Parastagonospora nodorum]KAH3971264.1 hypothetical protein HBH51_110820 [Parastagonospora nodorum]KAH4063434.1 hypothetical protein HBH50_189780 [Parastagonospora nodorum]KAH4083032.1 hypothetical protein HBH48_178520 [Parastagonospora nodorum]KAH4861814.1 hypothetical protein HBH75_028840 [Parastagonospora nodorum]